MKNILVRITGITAILMNKVSEEAMLQMLDKTKKKSKTATKLSPEEEAKKKIYSLNEKPIIPLEILMANLCNAGKMIRLEGKKQLSTNKSSLVPGILQIIDQILWLKNPDGNDFSKWGIATWK